MSSDWVIKVISLVLVTVLAAGLGLVIQKPFKAPVAEVGYP